MPQTAYPVAIRSESPLRRVPRKRARETDTAHPGLVQALGWFSVALGLTELLWPRRFGRGIGVGEPMGLLRALGMRKLTSGLGILSRRNTVAWMRSRVVGDLIDLALLGASLRSARTDRGKVAIATAAVASVTALDVLGSQRSRARAGDADVVEVIASIAITHPAPELYRVLRDLESLPRVLSHLKSVRLLDERSSHWIAKTLNGSQLEWDAEITEDLPDRRFAWRSLPGAVVPNEGVLELVPLPAGRGTAVRVELRFRPPGGRLVAGVGRIFAGAPEHQIREDLRRWKRLLETGEVPTTAGQPHGRRSVISRGLP